MFRRRCLTPRVAATVVVVAGVMLCTSAITRRPLEAHRRIKTTLTWKKDIAPIVQRRCAFCHSDDNIAPSFATFADARPWAAAMREEVLTRHMPPWSAVAGYGRFKNDPSLTLGEWDLLVTWVDGDAPSGQTLQEEQQPVGFATGAPAWDHGNPDVVLPLSTASVVAAGAPDVVKQFDVSTSFTADQRVRGVAFKPGDRRVVRYASVVDATSNRWLFSWTPSLHDLHLPDGVAFTLPAGARLRVEVGYRGAADAVTDTSAVGLYLDETRKGPVARVQSIQAAATLLVAGRATRIRAEAVLSETSALQAIWPEVPQGTTSFELTAVMPDGGVRPLLWLRQVRTEWPAPYVSVDPVPLPAGTRVIMTAYVTATEGQASPARPRASLVLVPTTATTF